MEQMAHIADTKNAFSATTSVPSVPFPDTILAMPWYTFETKPAHHVSPHTPPSIPMPAQADPIQRRHKCHRHQLRNANNRELCVSLLTKAKLTRSRAGSNPGAIKYRQFTTDIPLELTERYKKLALEHHKCHKMRTPKASNAGCHAKTSGKAARHSWVLLHLLGSRAWQDNSML